MAVQTAERVSSHDQSDNVIYQRHLVAYNEAAKVIRGKVLEVGCGEGYGIDILAPLADSYTAIDKYQTEVDKYKAKHKHLSFQQISVPPLPFENDSFDCVVTFQVIEHIEEDEQMIREMARVLKSGGVLVMSTPNIKMSLTRNPWHVREYTYQELTRLTARYFSEVNMKGVFGNQKIMDYYDKNKASVKKFTRFDIFNLQYKLPRQILQIPYDILNRLNRRMLLNKNNNLVSDIALADYYTNQADDGCFDLLAFAVK